MAKFEVCCHKFADLSEHDYGVSILNDSKYGFATCGNMMRLSLLRAPKAPDAHADMGEQIIFFSIESCTNETGRHHIRYAILPHIGSLGPTTVRAGFEFNNPLRLVSPRSSSAGASVGDSLFNALRFSGPPSIILDTVKRGEDDEDVSRGELAKRKGRSVICRIYDSLGGTGTGTLAWHGKVAKAWRTNVLEDDGEELKVVATETKDGCICHVNVLVKPFEVVTVRLQL